MGMLQELIWRFRCPTTVELAARDFLEKRLKGDGVKWLSELEEEALFSDRTLDYQRRIAYIYGLEATRAGRALWNKKLLRSSKEKRSEDVVGQILRRAWELSKSPSRGA